MNIKKYIVLGILFLLPITVYLFFASGVNHFAKLPVLTTEISELDSFVSIEGDSVTFKSHITVLGFFGSSVASKEANAFNLAHKIYKKNYGFEDFQFIILATEDQRNEIELLKEELRQIEDPSKFIFALGTPDAISEVYYSLQTKSGTLDANYATNRVYIIDKEGSLRGRKDDKDYGVLYGFDASNYAEINNKMGDDVKIILAEYRLALKKYKSNREI